MSDSRFGLDALIDPIDFDSLMDGGRRIAAEPKSEPESATHECPYCHETKPKTNQFFELRRYVSKAGIPSESWRSQCRLCRRKHLRSATPGGPRHRLPGEHNHRDEPAYERGPKPCVACHDMPWRVLGPRCPCCKLVYALEPRPEVQLRRFDSGVA